jgi:hypothetical protein
LNCGLAKIKVDLLNGRKAADMVRRAGIGADRITLYGE